VLTARKAAATPTHSAARLAARSAGHLATKPVAIVQKPNRQLAASSELRFMSSSQESSSTSAASDPTPGDRGASARSPQRPLDQTLDGPPHGPGARSGYGAGPGFRDSVWLGLALGLLFPAATWLGLEALSDRSLGLTIFGYPFAGFSDSFVATIAVCANFIPFFVFMRAHRDHAMRGVGLVTMVLAVIVVALFFLQLGEPA
jgi:hypothetical protein